MACQCFYILTKQNNYKGGYCTDNKADYSTASFNTFAQSNTSEINFACLISVLFMSILAMLH